MESVFYFLAFVLMGFILSQLWTLIGGHQFGLLQQSWQNGVFTLSMIVLTIIFLLVLNVAPAFAVEWRWVRVTHYTLQGTMYNGEPVSLGSAACSWNFPIGTVIVFKDGKEVVCKDRGHLGWYGWVDVWGPRSEIQRYGYWEAVTVFE